VDTYTALSLERVRDLPGSNRPDIRIALANVNSPGRATGILAGAIETANRETDK
jgi:hypothetical protein